MPEPLAFAGLMMMMGFEEERGRSGGGEETAMVRS